MPLLIPPSAKLLMIGDSITDAGREKPVAEGLFDPLGRGYVTMVEAVLGAFRPRNQIRIVNMGTSGDTVRDLKARWKTDVLDLKPTWLSVMIGINDVWRQFDSPKRAEIQVLPAEYEKTLDALLRKTKPLLDGLVLMTPFYLEPSLKDPMRRRMDEYGAIVKKLAARHGAVFVDTQAAFDRALEGGHSAALAWDRVHPNQAGHMILARAFLEAVGFDWT
ncbi:MAG: SGNH/GDSL hydrolase family protein [Verrucomicrobium sp.]|nr:SGNH/GDSL hydrolase family protein [Verrucomicrobium sp.]